jgi:hypothetical protein
MAIAARRVNKEITNLCATSNPSILRKTSKEDLINFSWENVHKELKERAPMFMRFIEASVQNPSQAKNAIKKDDELTPPMCDAASQLISIFSEGMCVTRRIKSVILKKNGLKKIGFQRLARIYVCMGYKSTNKMFETFAKDFDMKLLSWKEQVEKDVKGEREILSKLSELDPNNEEEVRLEGDKLAKHRESMHPSYSFAGDNVDIMIKPRQMMKSKQNKDFHMFQNVAYENRISPNHLSDDQPVVDVDKISWLTFLPSAKEQASLAEEITVLVCQQWAKYIPALSWFNEYVPPHTAHKHMEDVKKKTNKVIPIAN